MCDTNHQGTIGLVEHELPCRSTGVLTISQDQWDKTSWRRKRKGGVREERRER